MNNTTNNRRGQPFSPAAQLKKALFDLDAAKQKIVSLEIELARQRAGALKQDMHAAAEPKPAAAPATEAPTAPAPEPATPAAEPKDETPEAGPADAKAEADAESAETDGGATLENDLAALTEALEKANEERALYLDLARRAQADLENYRKRTQKEYASLKRESLGDFLKDFFGAFDDLDRVIAAAEKDPAAVVFKDGVRLARENLWRTLAKCGVNIIAQTEGIFDPQHHEVIAAIPAPGKPAGTILEVFQPGYQLDDFVLRPAKVVVAQS